MLIDQWQDIHMNQESQMLRHKGVIHGVIFVQRCQFWKEGTFWELGGVKTALGAHLRDVRISCGE